MSPLSRQDEQFLRMLKVKWDRQAPVPVGTAVSRADYEEAMRYALFYEEESHKKNREIEQLTAQRNYLFLAAIAGLAGMTAAASIIAAIKLVF